MIITNEFKSSFTKISKQGFVVDQGEAIDGITGVAAPIRDFTGKVVVSVGIGFISSSEDQKGLQKIVKDIMETARAVSQKLGHLDRK